MSEYRIKKGEEFTSEELDYIYGFCDVNGSELDKAIKHKIEKVNERELKLRAILNDFKIFKKYPHNVNCEFSNKSLVDMILKALDNNQGATGSIIKVKVQ